MMIFIALSMCSKKDISRGNFKKYCVRTMNFCGMQSSGSSSSPPIANVTIIDKVVLL